MEGGAYSEFPHGDVGFPKGDSPEEFLAKMEAFLNKGAAKLECPTTPPVFSPAVMRDLAAFQEAVIEQEVRKSDAGNPTVTSRVDMLRKDVWDRWRARASDPPPGNIVIWRGLSKLTDIELGAELSATKNVGN